MVKANLQNICFVISHESKRKKRKNRKKKSTTSIKNAPIVVILNEEYKQYRNQGNMKAARITELPKDVDGDICPNTIDRVMLNEIDYTNGASGMFDIVYDTIESKCNTYKLERK